MTTTKPQTAFVLRIPDLVDQINFERVLGDFAEVGVLAGRTLVHIIRAGFKAGQVTHAFDSFCGMGPPGPHDGDEYPEGRFNMGGLAAFQEFFERVHQIPPTQYRAWEGFIPECFVKYQEAMRNGHQFSLVHIDVDHYLPTLDALHFFMNRISKGGFLVLHDYLPTNKEKLATRAIEEWLAVQSAFEVLDYQEIHLFLRRVR
jgi:hypothetical protein